MIDSINDTSYSNVFSVLALNCMRETEYSIYIKILTWTHGETEFSIYSIRVNTESSNRHWIEIVEWHQYVFAVIYPRSYYQFPFLPRGPEISLLITRQQIRRMNPYFNLSGPALGISPRCSGNMIKIAIKFSQNQRIGQKELYYIFFIHTLFILLVASWL